MLFNLPLKSILGEAQKKRWLRPYRATRVSAEQFFFRRLRTRAPQLRELSPDSIRTRHGGHSLGYVALFLDLRGRPGGLVLLLSLIHI